MKKSILPYVLVVITIILFHFVTNYYPEYTIIDKILVACIDAEIVWICCKNGNISKNELLVLIVLLLYNFLYPFLDHNAVTVNILLVSRAIIFAIILYKEYCTRIKKQ